MKALYDGDVPSVHQLLTLSLMATTSTECLPSLLLIQMRSYILTRTCCFPIFLSLSGGAAPRLMVPHHNPAPGSKHRLHPVSPQSLCRAKLLCEGKSSVQSHVCIWYFPLQSNFEWIFILRDNWKWTHMSVCSLSYETCANKATKNSWDSLWRFVWPPYQISLQQNQIRTPLIGTKRFILLCAKRKCRSSLWG